MARKKRPPNLILLITDQQRAVQHWPDDPKWLDQLTPNDALLRATGVDFGPILDRDGAPTRCATAAGSTRCTSTPTLRSRPSMSFTT